MILTKDGELESEDDKSESNVYNEENDGDEHDFKDVDMTYTLITMRTLTAQV